MARLSPADVLDAAAYERLRERYAAAVGEQRASRRLRLGSDATLRLENVESGLWHVHELLRWEGHGVAAVARTLADVQPWVPPPGELRATIMIDADDATQGRVIAEALAQPGAVELRCGGSCLRSSPTGPTTAPDEPVWYLRWVPDAHWRAAVENSRKPVWLTAHWSGGPSHILVPAALRAALVADLRAGDASTTILHRLAAGEPHVPSSPRHSVCA